MTTNTISQSFAQPDFKERLRQSYGFLQSIAVLLLLVMVMSFVSPRFATLVNFQNLMAQMAPAMTPKVQTGKPNTMVR